MEARCPRVSIVTASLNSREFIADAIRSVAEQSYENIEHIIVDGGSTDGTLDLIRANARRISTWTSEQDEGIADAFNKGLRRVTGEYVLFLNSDDWLASSCAVDKAMNAARCADWPEIVFGDCDIVDRASGICIRQLRFGWSPFAFRFGRMINHPALFTHRSYFEQHGEFDKTFRIAMDFELLARGISSSRVLHVPEVVTKMRAGGVSMRRRDQVVEEIIRALRKNTVIRSGMGEVVLRAYFEARRVLRPLRRARTAIGSAAKRG